jgi:hypothetical protein
MGNGKWQWEMANVKGFPFPISHFPFRMRFSASCYVLSDGTPRLRPDRFRR